VLDRLAGETDPDSNLALAGARRLGALGDAGLAAARRALDASQPLAVITAVRVLLAGALPADRARVAERLAGRLPRGTEARLLDEVVRLDPVLATSAWLVGLLDHASPAMRSAAARRLAARPAEDVLPALADALRSDRAGTREAALALVAATPGPLATRLLVDRLGDPLARIAGAAVTALAGRSEELAPAASSGSGARSGPDAAPEALDELLVERAFDRTAPDRRRAYALLAIVAREDARGGAVLDERHAPALLGDLRSVEPVLTGAAAAALAGIGFRSTGSRDMGWLDREVPHELVRLASGAVFHSDFTALQDHALRRLDLISGAGLGSDGPAWQAWWMEHAAGFRARRAVIGVEPAERGSLAVVWRTPDEELRFFGPDAAADGLRAAPPGVEAYCLDLDRCAEVLGLFEREGLLGAGELPTRGSLGIEASVLDVAVGEQGKRFEFLRDPPAWVGRVAELLERLAERSRWQLFYDRGRHGSQLEAWRDEAAWWAAERPEAERLDREVQRLYAAIEAGPDELRDRAIERLVALAERRPTPPGELRSLLAALSSEPEFGPSARALFGLALDCARTASGDRLDPVLAAEMEQLLVGRFGAEAGEAAREVLSAGGIDAIEAAAGSEVTGVRLAAAHAAGAFGELAPPAEGGEIDPAASERAGAALLVLLDDPDADVAAAAAASLAGFADDAVRTELLVRARVGPLELRQAALRAIGRLGAARPGADVLDALVLGLSDSDPHVELAAVQGVARLGDPRTSAHLVAAFQRGPSSPLFSPAREGLRRLGDAAQADLLRLAVSGDDAVQREAALLLAEAGVPQAAPLLMTVLTARPDDARVVSELAVLTGEDLSDAADPGEAWWGWWDHVVHDDALAWFLGAAERAGLHAPDPADLTEPWTRGGADFLLDVMARGPAHLAERARRELGERLGRDLGPLPPREERAPRLEALRAEVDRRLRGG